MAARTEAFTAIRSAPINDLTSFEVRSITHTVVIPGLTARGGGPLTVKRTYVIDEIAYDWVSVIVDYEFGDAPAVYGNHPLAVGPLREILPEGLPQKPYPALRRSLRDGVVRMLAHHDLGGWVTMPVIDDRTLEIKPPVHVNSDIQKRRYFATVREYFPYKADLWWDDAADVIRVRPTPENQENHVVHTT